MKRDVFLGLATAAAFVPQMAAAADADVSIAYAGSLVTLMEKSLGPAFAATGYTYEGEGRGSTAIANLIRDGLRTPDVFISADIAAIESLRGTAGHDTAKWYTTFASTRMQIAYSAKSKFAADFAAAARGTKPWYAVLQQPGLAKRILGDDRNAEQIVPEEVALARLQTGDVDAIWAYSTESTSRGLDFVDLPPQINLGDPKESAGYAAASVVVGMKTFRGAPIVYAVTIPTKASNPSGGAAFVAFLLGTKGKALLARAGLSILRASTVGDRSAIPPVLIPILR